MVRIHAASSELTAGLNLIFGQVAPKGVLPIGVERTHWDFDSQVTGTVAGSNPVLSTKSHA